MPSYAECHSANALWLGSHPSQTPSSDGLGQLERKHASAAVLYIFGISSYWHVTSVISELDIDMQSQFLTDQSNSPGTSIFRAANTGRHRCHSSPRSHLQSGLCNLIIGLEMVQSISSVFYCFLRFEERKQKSYGLWM